MAESYHTILEIISLEFIRKAKSPEYPSVFRQCRVLDAGFSRTGPNSGPVFE